jgi:hypothetical protein
MELGCSGVQQRMRRAAVDSPDLVWVEGVGEQGGESAGGGASLL